MSHTNWQNSTVSTDSDAAICWMRRGRALCPTCIDEKPMLIPCPHCGTRPVEEFTFLGDASAQRPESNDPSSMPQWQTYVYERENPRGNFSEYVHHSGGCRAWLVINRNTGTHEVQSVVTACDFKRKQEL